MISFSSIVVAFALLIGITVLPVMLSAKLIHAGKTGFGSALLAVFLQACLSGVIQSFVPNIFIAALIAIIGGSAIYAFVLDTTMLRGFAICILTLVITVVTILLLAGSLSVLGIAT
jgi:hypothetical protein